MRRIAHHGAAVRLFHGDTDKPERTHLLPQVGGELVGAVDLGGARGDLGLSEAAHRGSQHVDVLAESEAQPRQLDRRGTAGEVAGSIHSRSFQGERKTLLYVYVNVNYRHQVRRARAGGLRRLAPTRILRDWRSNARISESTSSISSRWCSSCSRRAASAATNFSSCGRSSGAES